jgi:replicative DNA helicase
MQYEVSDKFELHIIRGILSDPSLFVRARSILKPEYFEDNPTHSNNHCMKVLHETYEKFNSLPMLDLLNQILKHKNPQEQPLERYAEWNPISDSEMLLVQIEDFCRHRACIGAALKVYKDIEKGETTGVVKTIEEAVMVKLPSDFGISLFDDNLAQQLKELHQIQNELKTGWTTVDNLLQGGFGYGEINVFAAIPGGGKSLCLMNLALNYANQGLNIMYFTLELSPGLTRKRMVGVVSDYELWKMKGNEEAVAEKFIKTINDKAWLNHGDLQVIQLPNGSKPIDIQTIVNEYELKFEKTINVIIVDYADLMSPNGKISNENIHMSQKSIYEDLRNWVVGRTKKGLKSTIFTATQLTKDSMRSSEDELSQGSLSGSAYKSYTCDNLISIHRVEDSDTQKKLLFLKTRNSAGTNKTIILNYNPDTIRLSDCDVMSSGNPDLDKLIEKKKPAFRQ